MEDVYKRQELFYSMGFDFEYKGLGINAQFQGAGHYTIQRSLSCFYAPLMNNQTISEHYLENCWRSGKDNTDAIYPRLTTTESANNYRGNSVFMKNISFLKLRSAEIYYKLPESCIKPLRLREFKLFAKGMDPVSYTHLILSEEKFMKNQSFINYLKIRGSYGIVGNDLMNTKSRFFYLPDAYNPYGTS